MPGSLAMVFAAFTDLQTKGNIAPYVAVFAFGFVIAVVGHVARARELIIAGIFIAGVSAVLPWIVWGNA